MDEGKLDKLIEQCRSNDVDVRVDAVTKLQTEFEAGAEVTDPDGLITVLKACLRSSNHHLSTATLSALPPLIPTLVSRSLSRSHVTPTAGSPSTSTSSVATSSHVDAPMLRHVMTAFLPAGGVIDRLGDSREKPREKALQVLVLLGGYSFRSGPTSGSALAGSKSREGKGPDTLLTIFERYMREVALASKVWRVREQAILTLVHIRREHHLFPIRPFLPLLISSLEDSDANVRECAKESVYELFTGPAVTDAARADLKKELTKKSVRKNIAEALLARIFAAGGRAGSVPVTPVQPSENGDAEAAQKEEYIPPSLALVGRRPTVGTATGPAHMGRSVSQGNVLSRPGSRAGMAPTAASAPATPTENPGSEVQPAYIASDKDLESEFAAMVKPFEDKESEHNWAARERAILRVRGMLKGDVHLRYTETFLACLQAGFIAASFKTLASLRTTVASNTCSLYTELTNALGTNMDPFCEPLLTHLLAMAGFTKKIIALQSQSCVSNLISHISAQPRTIIHLLGNTSKEKNPQARTYAFTHIKLYIEVHGTRAKSAIESSGNADVLAQLIKKGLNDSDARVRDQTRLTFWTFESIWPDRARTVLGSLDAPNKKMLEKVCPDPAAAKSVLASAGVTQPPTKKSSVAAAIAASRAKARAIANAPPSLMHQATSMSHAQRATSPPLRRSASPALSSKSSSGGAARPASPSVLRPPSTSPRASRILSTSRSVSSSGASQSLPMNRSASGRSPPTSPRSPSSDLASRRRISSPLTTTTSSPDRSSTLRKAMMVALPDSPPNSTLVKPPTPPVHRPAQTRTIASILSAPLHAHARERQSSLLSDLGDDNDSLLLATNIPIPDGSDSDNDMDDTRRDLISFSTPTHQFRRPPMRSGSIDNTLSSHSMSQAMSSPRSDTSRPLLSSSFTSTSARLTREPSEALLEDALRSTAEQAQSAADRLLELVDPDDEGSHHSTIPKSLLLRNHGSLNGSNGSATPKVKAKVTPMATFGGARSVSGTAPSTPANRNSAILRQAALFKDSPPYNGKTSSLVDTLNDRKHETGWWLKRMAVMKRGAPLNVTEPSDRVGELERYIAQLEAGSADVNTLQKLALLSIENPVQDPLSPNLSTGSVPEPMSPSPLPGNSRALPSLHGDMWADGKRFDRLFDGLMKALDPTKSEEQLEYALIVLWELLEHQALDLENREADIFSALLRVRFCNKLNVMEATNTIRDALTARVDPVYGLTTMHASLRAFHTEPAPVEQSRDVKAGTYAFGLIALGKFVLRLPAEVLEDELPRLKTTLIHALSDASSLVVRESAAAAIVAAQLVLRDEALLFALLDGLADEKKNLLTYLFDKHSARGVPASASTADDRGHGNGNRHGHGNGRGLGLGQSGMEKLAKEMRRLDTRTSTPPRPRVLSKIS